MGNEPPIVAADLEARIYSDTAAMHPDDANMLDAATVCGMKIYMNEELIHGES